MQEPKRIVGFFEAAVGGAERVFLQYMSQLAASGRAVHVVVGGVPSVGERSTLEQWMSLNGLHRIAWRKRRDYAIPVVLPSLDFTQIKSLNTTFRDLNPDMVIINQPGPDDAQAAISAATSHGLRAPVLCFVHLAAPDLIKMRLRPLKLAWSKRVYRNVRAVVTCSHASARSLVDRYGLASGKVHTVWNGVPDTETDRSNGCAELRRELGIGDPDTMVLWGGRYTIEKGVDVLLASIDSIPVLSGVRVVLAGDGPLRSLLCERFKHVFDTGRVMALGWRSDLDRLMAASDVVVMPSTVESFPLLLLEALAAGKPVVATRVHGIPEIIEDGKTGILVPPQDCSALAEGIMRLAADPELRRFMGSNGRARYEKHFTMDKALERFMRVIEAYA